MIYRIGQHKRPWPAAIALVGYWLIVLMLLGTATPYSETARRLEARAVAQVWAYGRPSIPGAIVYVPETAPPATTNRFTQQLSCYRTNWFGEQVTAAYQHQQPRFDLPQSPYGNAQWSPLTDDIRWEPFLTPGLGYYTGTLHPANTSAALDTAIANAADTDIIEIDVGVTMTTSSAKALRTRGDGGWVLVRTDDTTWLTTTATDRVAEADASHMPTLRTQSTASFFTAAQGARGWDLRGLHFANAGPLNPAGGLVQWRPNQQTQASHQGTYLNLDKCLFTNPYVLNAGPYCRRAVALGGEFQIVRRCAVYRMCEPGADTQAVWMNNGVGKGLVEDCTLEANGEIFYWGGAVQAMGAASTCADWCMRKLYLFRSTALRTGTDVRGVQKNFGETKIGLRLLIDMVYGDGLNATAQPSNWNFGAKPQAAAETAFVILQNLTMRYVHCNDGIGAAQIHCAPGVGGTSLNGVQRIEVYHYLTTNPNSAVGGSNRWEVGVGAVANVRHLNDLVIRNTTTGGFGGVYLIFGMNKDQDVGTMARFQLIDNIGYGAATNFGALFQSGGATNKAILDDISVGGDYSCKYNVQWASFWGAPLKASPHFNADAANLAAIGFVDAPGGNYELAGASAYKGLSTVPGTDPGIYRAGLVARLAGITS